MERISFHVFLYKYLNQIHLGTDHKLKKKILLITLYDEVVVNTLEIHL